MIKRLSGRRTCPGCGEIYHIRNIPPKRAGLCDRCGTELIQRSDDSESTIRRRFQVYESETAPLIEYYKSQHLLRDVSGDLEVKELEPIVDKILFRAGQRH